MQRVPNMALARHCWECSKRVVWHLSSSLTSISVTTFVKRTHAIKGIGSWSSSSASSTRRVLTQSPDECMDLLRADAFIKDAFGRLAMLDALNNFIDELGGAATMVSWTGPNKATRVIRCLFGHVANVSFRVRSWPLPPSVSSGDAYFLFTSQTQDGCIATEFLCSRCATDCYGTY